ncbi:lipid A biosynthesis acyltransferase [Myroides sp. 1354]|uniref:lysophospholipid acyltransferase family protein n=1 Tax=unclassified Myroides TaxID=2642485 RepID=UPI0025754D86|nr:MULTISPECIES: lipid A biosynthesis acyltransferase [unclassified Myroides]MDM1044098.1 lipid A biosynthesis acyltransferase [Myroides sp. R163-1]MDM1055033.1 lipid A biosynthesis acyltransferase [Myroides sp. 1354]MDM1068330.1 lipid A biosynthesis acyltransferase [Myroides sp. 1372]
MKLLIYYIAYPILWLISKLPFPIFYFVSDCFFVLLYHLVRYRRKAVTENIKLTMPHLSDEEVQKIVKQFYKHLCDIFLEMIKTFTIPEEELKKRFQFTNLDTILDVEKQGKSALLFCAHYANWEWLIILDKFISFQGYAVYKKLGNPHFDNLFLKIRTRFNTRLIEMKETIRVIRQNEVNKNHGIYAFISDQSPMIGDANYWQNFMGIEVPVFTGGEALCKKFNMEPMYLKVEYVKRGHYQATFIPLRKEGENVKEIPNYELTNRFLQEVEKQIHQAPAYYFWTHKRWKHRGKKPANIKSFQ